MSADKGTNGTASAPKGAPGSAASTPSAVGHTPGPWYVGAQNDGLYIIDGPPSPGPYDGPIPREYGPQVVATPNWRLPAYQANARLIAAAPDLLEACQRTLEMLESIEAKTLVGDEGCLWGVEIARYALAKAKGE